MLRWILFQRPQVRLLILLLSLNAAVFGLLGPLFQKLFVDRLLGVETPVPALSLAFLQHVSLVTLVLATFLSVVIAQASSLAANYVALKEGTYIQGILSESLYLQMLTRRNDQWGGRTVGDIVALYASDVPGSTAVIDQSLPMGAAIIFPLLVAPLAIYSLSGLPLSQVWMVIAVIVAINFILASRQSRFFYRFKQLASERIAIVNEWVQNIRVLRILGWIEPFEVKIKNKRIEETDNRVRMVTNGQTMGALGSSVSFIVNLLGVLAVVQLKKEQVTPGELFALLWIFGVFLNRPFRQIPWIFTFTLDALTSLRRVEGFLQVQELKTDFVAPHNQELEPVAAALHVRRLHLKYQDITVLQDVDFTVKAGEFVAIVGEVGSGKSLLLQSLMGETPATFDSLEINGQEFCSQSIEARRPYFSFVPQEGFVMSSSLRDNVAFCYDAVSSEDSAILAALQKSQFDPIAERVNGGLEAEIGERGVNLSGGQKQRVGLARAEYLNRPILLLDDSLSAVDVDTEQKLYDTLLNGSWQNRTRILVTHRLSILDKVHRIYFMRAGQVLAHGSLRDLMNTSPEFCEFIMEQNEEASPPAEKKGDLLGNVKILS